MFGAFFLGQAFLGDFPVFAAAPSPASPATGWAFDEDLSVPSPRRVPSPRHWATDEEDLKTVLAAWLNLS